MPPASILPELETEPEMGLLRKALHITTVGVIAPNSTKQRVAKQTLVAIQGGSPAQVRRAGGRYEHGPAAAIENARVARERAAQAQAQHNPSLRLPDARGRDAAG
jgi:hypothetical protein